MNQTLKLNTEQIPVNRRAKTRTKSIWIRITQGKVSHQWRYLEPVKTTKTCSSWTRRAKIGQPVSLHSREYWRVSFVMRVELTKVARNASWIRSEKVNRFPLKKITPFWLWAQLSNRTTTMLLARTYEICGGSWSHNYRPCISFAETWVMI